MSQDRARRVRKTAKSTKTLAAALTAIGALTCACGSPKPAIAPGGAHAELTRDFEHAFHEEATGDPERATQEYVRLIEVASRSPNASASLAVLDASLDALVMRRVPALDAATLDGALAFRRKGEAIDGALESARRNAHDLFGPGVIARALERLAEHRGDAAAAEKWRGLRGCAREAMVIGPTAWATVTGVHEHDSLDAEGAKLEASYKTPGPFGASVAPALVRGRGCGIDLTGPSATLGVRDVVVDVDVPRAQRIGLALRAHSAATLRAGGRVVIERPYDLGSGDATRRAWVDAPAGRMRLVAKVGMTEDGESLEIDAWDDVGQPLAMVAPKIGEAATSTANASQQLRYPPGITDDDRLAFAAGALALGDGRTAEHMLESDVRDGASPDLALVYARAVDTARDLSQVIRAERARSAYERVLESWPGAWEAILSHAVLAGTRRASNEARMEALRDLDAHRAKSASSAFDGTSAAEPRRGQHLGAPLLDAWDAATSGREHLFDRAAEALERARPALEGSSLFFDAAGVTAERVGAERVAHDCDPSGARARDRLDCEDALRVSGDHAGAMRELDRVRAVRGGPMLYLPLALREALTFGDTGAATAIQEAMTPGERTLSALFALQAEDRGASPEARRAQLRAIALSARDPNALPALLTALGDDPLQTFEGMAERVVAEDRAKPIMPEAATAVLAHTERYEVFATGLAHAVLFDVRRVSGTTDVDQNAQADAPDLIGRSTLRAVRRRIFKPDGRVLEPDHTPRASQSHADLSQLEKGDVVEAVYEGWSLPGETGDLGIDTPDLLPDRTAIHDATIELTLPRALASSAVWSHPLLGKPTETTSGDSRTLKWELLDHPVRRLEEGVPRMDRNVDVSFATTRWDEVARGLRETLASLDDHDPEIAAWAKEAARGQAAGSRELVAAIVTAAGASVREAQASVLSDFGIGRSVGAQAMTARTILTEHEGSRSWLIVRALRELGVAADVVIAEDLPFSGNPAFPPHFGRFVHPLVIAHEKSGDVWIDADVAGPPLPAGRISPELRGRSMLRADGSIAAIPASDDADAGRDEIDIRLAIDPKGDAKGSVAIILRGRDAQEYAEVLFRIVGAERQQALRAIALAWVPFASVDDVALSSSEGSWQVAIRASVTASGYAQRHGEGDSSTWILPGVDPLHFVVPRARVSSLGATYASQGSREDALAINSAVQYHVHRRIELPSGTVAVRMPGPFELKAAHLAASRTLGVSGAVLEDDLLLSVPTGTVSAAEYGEFAADAHKTDDAFLASTWVKIPVPAPQPQARLP